MHQQGEIVAKDVRTGGSVRVVWEHGVITSVSPSPLPAPGGLWVAPPLVDLQNNGYAGVDFQSGEPDVDDLLRAARGVRAAGCTRFLLTLITDEWPRLLGRLQRLVAVRDRSVELRAAIPGWHIEGPFLSSKPGFHGAHNPAWMLDPTPAHMRAIRDAAPGDSLMITLAPERPGALEAIAEAVRLGIRVSLGHTDAPAAVIAEAVRAGADSFTHLANGCPQSLDRHDNIVWRVLGQPGMRVGLIPDGIHVSPALFRILHQAIPPGQIYYVSDAMSAAGAPPGRYRLGTMDLEVGEDQVVRRPGSPLFAGSALRPLDGVIRAAGMLGGGWQEAWLRFSDAPAAWIGWPFHLVPGAPAEFCVVETGPGDVLQGFRWAGSATR